MYQLWLTTLHVSTFSSFSQNNLLSPHRRLQLTSTDNHPLAIHSSSATGKKPVSIVLTAPPSIAAENVQCSKSPNGEQILSDPTLFASMTSSQNVVPRRASDDSRFYSTMSSGVAVVGTGRSNNLQVVNVTDNPFLQNHGEASDGVLALRADRERQRRHSTCPGNNRHQKSFK